MNRIYIGERIVNIVSISIGNAIDKLYKFHNQTNVKLVSKQHYNEIMFINRSHQIIISFRIRKINIRIMESFSHNNSQNGESKLMDRRFFNIHRIARFFKIISFILKLSLNQRVDLINVINIQL